MIMSEQYANYLKAQQFESFLRWGVVVGVLVVVIVVLFFVLRKHLRNGELKAWVKRV